MAKIKQPEVVQVQSMGKRLEGLLDIPSGATGIVLFAHGSGSSRHSPRNHFVAEVLREGRLATLLFDLLTPDEESEDLATRAIRFDIELLAGRVLGAIEWLSSYEKTSSLPIGLFGASTGAAAALIAAATRPREVQAVVSRGGRPDLADVWLGRVEAPTLLIVGGADHLVLDLNKEALEALNCEKRLEVIPGATHLFEEPGTLKSAATAARTWFQDHLHELS